jgi:hypothetical protein
MKKLFAILGLLTLLTVPAQAQTPPGGYGPGGSSSSTSTPGGTGTIGTTGIPTRGLTADYQMKTGTGTTEPDSAGISGNASFCASAPAWGQAQVSPYQGIQFNFSGSQCINFPSSLNNSLTVHALLSFDGPAANYFNQNASLFGCNGNGATGHTAGVVAVETDGTNQGGMFQLDAIGGVAGNAEDIYMGYLNSTVLVSITLDGVSDQIYINGVPLGLVAGATSGAGQCTIGNWAAGFVSGFNTSPTTLGYQGSLYRILFYSVVQTPQEIQTVANNVNYFVSGTSQTPNFPCCAARNSGLGNDTNSVAGIIGDSISAGTLWKSLVLVAQTGETWSVPDLGIGGSTQAECLKSGVWCTGPTYRPNAGKNVAVFWAGGNDINNGATAFAAFSNLCPSAKLAKSNGMAVGITTLISRNLPEATRNVFNNLLRTNWKSCGADFLVDQAEETAAGADNQYTNTVYFPDGVHEASALNGIALLPAFQRNINRFYGNRDLSTANTYTTAAPAANVPTACSESTNTVTVTSTLNPGVGNRVYWQGAIPALYNTFEAGSFVFTSSATNFTILNANSGLGICTSFGTVYVAQQKDVDATFILGGAGAIGNYQMDTCLGLTGQNVTIKNTNTTASAWTLQPWDPSELFDGAGTFVPATGPSVATFTSTPTIGTSIASTAVVEVANTVTVTSTLAPPVNAWVAINGVTPAGFNGVYKVATTSGTNFTLTNPTAGLGTASVNGFGSYAGCVWKRIQ